MPDRRRASGARRLAYRCLERCRKRDSHARDVLDRMLEEGNLDRRERAFATVLVMGVVSTVGTLDGILDGCMRTPNDVNDDVRTALRISAYEMLFLGKPSHSAVDQGVRLVAESVPRAKGVANAVLRKVAKASASFPFGDPSVDLRAAATEQGYPVWMAERLASRVGYERASASMRASNEPAPVFIACNPFKTDEDTVSSAFSSSGCETMLVEVGNTPIPGCLWVPDPHVLHEPRIRKLFSDGAILVSDAASQAIVYAAIQALYEAYVDASEAIAEEEGVSEDGSTFPHALSCLDLCCGRGTKTILLQAMAERLLDGTLAPFATVDNIPFKVKETRKRAVRYGVPVTEAVCADILEPGSLDAISRDVGREGGFDLVFLDAPCTGTGTLRRHPEIRWKVSPEDIVASGDRAYGLLAAASGSVAPGGILAYSTCSAEPEEDESVVGRFLESDAGSGFAVVPSSLGMGSDMDPTAAIGWRTWTSDGISPSGHPFPDAHYHVLLQRRR